MTSLVSKKFFFVLVCELSWKAILLGGLVFLHDNSWAWWFLLVATLVTGFVEAGYLGGQVWLDRYVKIPQVLGHATEKARLKDEKGTT